MSEQEKKPTRTFNVLREIEVPIEDMRNGDIFRIDKASPDDTVNDQQFYQAEADPKEQGENKTIGISASPIGFVKLLETEKMNFSLIPETYKNMFFQGDENANSEQPGTCQGGDVREESD